MPTITQLPVATTVGPTDEFVIVQSGITKQVQASVVNNTIVPTLLNGQTVIGVTGQAPVAGYLTPGANITITNAAGAITISSTGGSGFTWTLISGSPTTMTSWNGYVTNDASLATLTLPAASNFGDLIEIVGRGAGGWLIAQNAGQQIIEGNQATTTGVTGSVASTYKRNCITLRCTVANLEWQITSSQGILTFT
jgi:hypothetical protein